MNLEPIKKYFIPNRILDIGAHFGEFAQTAKIYFPETKIVCIEANKDCEETLRLTGFEYHIVLLGSLNNSKVIFFKNKEDPTSTGNSIYRELTHHYRDDNIIKEQLIMKTLDKLFVDKDKNFDLIKINTQGSEIDILKGAGSLIKNIKGIILRTAVTKYNQNAPLESAVIQYMGSINFSVQETLTELSWVNQKDLLFIKNG